MIGIGGAPDAHVCSRAGCERTAAWRIDWSNPKIHTDGRTKTWLACDEHVDYLREFLGAREFPLTVSALDAEAAS